MSTVYNKTFRAYLPCTTKRSVHIYRIQQDVLCISTVYNKTCCAYLPYTTRRSVHIYRIQQDVPCISTVYNKTFREYLLTLALQSARKILNRNSAEIIFNSVPFIDYIVPTIIELPTPCK
jgi:hypothetical protein